MMLPAHLLGIDSSLIELEIWLMEDKEFQMELMMQDKHKHNLKDYITNNCRSLVRCNMAEESGEVEIRKIAVLIDGNTAIKGLDGVSFVNFWSWAYSDFLSNTVRPLLAEFVVGHALGVVESPRIEWDAVDFNYNSKKIEVKSAARQQSWKQDKPSVISFDIAKKKAWHADTNTYEAEAGRSSDCYVFCFDPTYDKEQISMDINSWEFYIFPTCQIDEEFKDQKSVRLSRIRKLSRPSRPIRYNELKKYIDQALNWNIFR